jgi:hypothetical protein
MSVTLTNLLALVDAELDNYPMAGSAKTEGDGVTAAFLVAPLGSTIVEDETFACYIDDVLTTAYTMDYDSGVCTMAAVPATDEVVKWQFTYKQWTQDLVTQAINAGIDNLFPSIYVRSNETVTAGAEVVCPTGTEFVVGVDTGGAGAWKRLQRKRYDVIYNSGIPSLHFFTTPTGSVRVHYVARPIPLVNLSDDIESDSKIPARAANPIVSYACYYLLVQKMGTRVRSDVGIVTQGQGALMPSQMNYGAQGYMMRFQFQLASMKMPLWSLS